jgi:hypothetical protein
VAEAAARLDRAALADGGGVTRALARASLAGLIDGSGDGAPEEGWTGFGDDSVATPGAPSASMGTLL